MYSLNHKKNLSKKPCNKKFGWKFYKHGKTYITKKDQVEQKNKKTPIQNGPSQKEELNVSFY